MKFGLLYEHQLPRSWEEKSDYDLLHEAIEQVELADRLGFDYVWENEHHFLEEYSHSSAPEVFLAACSRNTKQIRLGHAVVLSPPPYNHPARVAERIATLDLISHGRVDWGTGESGSRVEMEGFGVPMEDKKAMWAEATEQSANMMTMAPYPGFEGRFFSMPTRNVLPKPYQQPHPPLWVACSRMETIHAAARAGIGALTFAFVNPDVARSSGSRNTTPSSSPMSACPSAIRSTPISPCVPDSRCTATPRRRSGAARTASAISAIRWGTTMCSASTSPA